MAPRASVDTRDPLFTWDRGYLLWEVVSAGPLPMDESKEDQGAQACWNAQHLTP